MNYKLKGLIYKGVKRPREVPHQLYWSTFGKLHCLSYNLAFDHQYDLIHNDLLKEDKFLLIIIDACRFDVFNQEANQFFKGDIENIYSPGRDTFEYVKNTWDGNHKDILYVSGATPVNSKVDNSKNKTITRRGVNMYNGYTPKKHLRINDVWDHGWADELGTVPPENVRKTAEDNLKKESKIVAHFFQPHTPYIGNYQILGGTGKQYGKGRGNPPDTQIWEKFRINEITEQEMRKAYRSNLRLAMKEVQKLIKNINDDRRVIITSDHGELFGEGKLYAHPRRDHPILREVPWMEVEEIVNDFKPRDVHTLINNQKETDNWKEINI